VAGVVLFAYDDDGQPNDKWESHAGGVGQAHWSRPCVRCSGGIKDCDGKNKGVRSIYWEYWGDW